LLGFGGLRRELPGGCRAVRNSQGYNRVTSSPAERYSGRALIARPSSPADRLPGRGTRCRPAAARYPLPATGGYSPRPRAPCQLYR